MAIQNRFPVGQSSTLSVGLGYEIVACTGMPDFISFPDDVLEAKVDNSSVNIGFHKLVLRGILSW